mgnify:FL=1
MSHSFVQEKSWKEQMPQFQGILSIDIRLSFRVMNLRSVVELEKIPFLFSCFLLCCSFLNILQCLMCSFIDMIQFDYLKSLEIEEKINKIRWCETANSSLFLLSTNDKTVKLWKVRFLDH